jgi:hypothetical protein
MAKMYEFSLRMSGTCSVWVEADSLDEAVEKIQNGEEKHADLNHWDIDDDFGANNLKRSWANKSDFKDEQ